MVLRRHNLWTFGLALLLACTGRITGAPPRGVDAGRSSGDEPADDLEEEAPAPEDDADVSLLTLLDDFAYVGRVGRPSSFAYKTRLASSYDRRAQERGTAAWYSNEDWSHFQGRIEVDGRTENVLLDTSGPGSLVRFWSANPQGTLRIYIDGEEAPTFEADMEALMSGQLPPLVSPFAYVADQGYNLYFPFPYSERCVVTVDEQPYEPDGKFYYHIQYREYPAGTPVVSLDAAAVDENAGAIESAARRLRGAELQIGDVSKNRRIDLAIDPSAATTETIAADDGGSRLRELRFDAGGFSDIELRRSVLKIRVDGEETVRVPLGDFFGVGPGVSPVATALSSVTEERELVARWPMPFSETMEITVQTAGDAPVLTGSASVEAFDVDDDVLYFHADWRKIEATDAGIPRDWTFANLSGRGLYVGQVLNVSNPSDEWWGEGDEKVYVDGEAFPSQFGTGIEDYFGYAWGSKERFSRPYHAQGLANSGDDSSGRASNYRVHMLDPYPFESGLRFEWEALHTLELLDQGVGTTVYYDGVVFWYGAPGSENTVPRASLGEFRISPE